MCYITCSYSHIGIQKTSIGYKEYTLYSLGAIEEILSSCFLKTQHLSLLIEPFVFESAVIKSVVIEETRLVSECYKTLI